MNKITALIPTFNPIKKWLQQTLDSCIGFDELIICNDGSENFNFGQYRLPKDTKVTFIQNETNLGCFQTINILCNQVTDGLITIQADDDYYNKDILPEIIERARLTEADVLYFPCQYFGKYQFIFGNVPRVEYKSLRQANYVYGSAFFTKDLWRFLEGFQLKVAGDWDFWVRAAKSGAKFEFYPRIGAYFRVSSRSMFENSLAKTGRAMINKEVQDNSDKWKKRYVKTYEKQEVNF